MTEMARQVDAVCKRGHRDSRMGTVVARSGDKTIRVRCSYSMRHPMYGKYVRRFTVLHSHDEKNEASVGDVVEVAACRRLSKMKCWRLVRVVEKG